MGTHLSLTPKTPDKMRVLLALTLLVAGALAGGKEKREMEMWMKMKAMEGCFGEELVKDHMIKMKRSAAKCMRVEAPELELPMFENSFRFANAMSRTPRRGMGMGGKKSMMKTFMMMQMFSDMMDSGSNRLQKRSHHEGEEGDFDLGSKLHEKLEHKKEHMEEMYGNMTCMLRECQVLDSENKFYPEGIKMEWDEWKNKIEDDWLRSQLEKYCDQCIEFAENLPQSMLDDCPWGGEMVKTKMYMKCMMKKKVKTCMRKDIKDKLEEHFGGVDKLVKETKIPEYELYEIVKQMLKGPEMMMMEMS